MRRSSSVALEHLQCSLHAFAEFVPFKRSVIKSSTTSILQNLPANYSRQTLYESFEVISVYWKLSPPMISMKESTRACNALALFQVMAKNPETRKELIEAKIPCYFYPFLKPCEDHDEPLEHVRITTLGVLGDLTKFDDPYGSHALHFFLESEVVPLCLKCMDVCDEMSRKVATLIVMNILTQERGLTYCCATPERFFAIVQVLRRVVEKLSPKPCLLHLEYVIQCYVCLSKIFRSIGPCDAFVRQIPPQLFDNTFRRTLLHDHEASWMLQVLHLNIYGCLYFPPIEERKKIAKKAASSSASSSKVSCIATLSMSFFHDIFMLYLSRGSIGNNLSTFTGIRSVYAPSVVNQIDSRSSMEDQIVRTIKDSIKVMKDTWSKDLADIRSILHELVGNLPTSKPSTIEFQRFCDWKHFAAKVLIRFRKGHLKSQEGRLANLWQVPTVTKYPSPFEAIFPGFSEPDILSPCLAHVHPQRSDISNSLLPQNFDEKSEYPTKTNAHKMYDKMLNNCPKVFTLAPLDDQIEMSDEDDIDLDISEIQQFHGSPQRDMSERYVTSISLDSGSPKQQIEFASFEDMYLLEFFSEHETKSLLLLGSIDTFCFIAGLKSIEEQPVEHEGLTTDVITGVACVIHLGNLESAKGTGVDLSVLKVSNSWFHSNTKTVALDSPSSLNRFTIVMS
ncbi:hypothetical protein KY290_032973 [Solanum tuberosum]|uniref:Cell differentiation protein rcd1 n=1 Tax=Solanum tuberosum TaxID=4113 RepID=A0ABQ7UGV9_SOLTU|nr:hypothetical protein KY290_032973 [Solanum tuberosum]